jgi:hypothetical protein
MSAALTALSTVLTRTTMNKDRFFLGFFAALRTQDIDFIDTRHDRHHTRFRRAVSALSDARQRGLAGAEQMPRVLAPSPYNARYKEFDRALIKLQKGDLGAHNPHYPGVSLEMDMSRANSILRKFPPPERAVFQQLAAAYLRDTA